MRILAMVSLCLAVVGLAGCGGSKLRSYNGPEVTQLLIKKSERKLYLLHGNEVLKEYKVGLGGNPIGPKQAEGDQKTPEGFYRIDRRNPNSAYHLSLGISYPNDQDRANAKEMGMKPGGDIFIHGRAKANRGRGKDWTAGCIAVKDGQMEKVYSMVKVGTPIYIAP